jgi:ribosomal protein S18 acetylase RimI-like enzyme
MLVEAANWDPGRRRLRRDEVFAKPQFADYVAGWKRTNDRGVVAEVCEMPVGAAWLRFLPAHDPGYGFIDQSIPELSIGVVEGWRGRGVGGSLLRALGDHAKLAGFGAMSLSVEVANPALALYERHGFVSIGIKTGAHTMRKNLTG